MLFKSVTFVRRPTKKEVEEQGRGDEIVAVAERVSAPSQDTAIAFAAIECAEKLDKINRNLLTVVATPL